jgi:hypothetical protein
MSNLFKTTSSLVFAAAAFAVISASATPASAQGVPADLLRLDSSKAYNAEANADIQQPKVRNTYAHVRKHHVSAQQ